MPSSSSIPFQICFISSSMALCRRDRGFTLTVALLIRPGHPLSPGQRSASPLEDIKGSSLASELSSTFVSCSSLNKRLPKVPNLCQSEFSIYHQNIGGLQYLNN
eukprot:GHVP01006556.1.p1 GENE.GHVP01006556.1~~GHVP01006556.1.p1  ORF type:complete len:104 (+),score=12.83 GHVP01006556.1:719-1030(+)